MLTNNEYYLVYTYITFEKQDTNRGTRSCKQSRETSGKRRQI